MKWNHKWVPEDLPSMNPNGFRSFNYNADISWTDDGRPPSEWVPVGWCRADELYFRPRPGVAIMFEHDGEQFWQHLEVYVEFGFKENPPCFRPINTGPISPAFPCGFIRCKACKKCDYLDRSPEAQIQRGTFQQKEIDCDENESAQYS